MNRFKNIVLAIENLEDNRAVVEKTLELAYDNQASLTLVIVLRHRPENITELIKTRQAIDISTIQEELQQKGIHRLEKLAKKSGIGELKVRARVLVGIPYLEIIKEVIRSKNDLLVIAGRKKISVKKKVFGSTTQHVLRKCPCPVWVMNPKKKTKKFGQVLAAIDDRHGDAVVDEINGQVLELALSLSQIEKVKLNVVEVFENLNDMSRYGYSGSAAGKLDFDDWHSAKSKQFHHFLNDWPIKVANCRIVEKAGNPGREIIRFVRKNKVGVLVMGTVCRAGISGVLIGNTAEKILRKVNCSILAIKPKGFVSPVVL